jgi:2-polyprenyl-6-methoxyphenol hydroxylase-like FAD-dependent oxidoreductase
MTLLSWVPDPWAAFLPAPYRNPNTSATSSFSEKCPKPNQSLDSVPSQRVYSINASTMKLFESLKLPIDTTRIGVTNTVKVWNDDGLLEFTDPQIGRVVEDGNITRALEEVRGNTDVHYDSQLKDYEVHSKKVNVLLDCGHRFSTKLLVGSDGNTTMIKDTAKINTYGWHENRMGIVCTLKLNQTITTAY